MGYLLCSRRKDGVAEYRRAEHVIEAYDLGYAAIDAEETLKSTDY